MDKIENPGNDDSLLLDDLEGSGENLAVRK